MLAEATMLSTSIIITINRIIDVAILDRATSTLIAMPDVCLLPDP